MLSSHRKLKKTLAAVADEPLLSLRFNLLCDGNVSIRQGHHDVLVVGSDFTGWLLLIASERLFHSIYY